MDLPAFPELDTAAATLQTGAAPATAPCATLARAPLMDGPRMAAFLDHLTAEGTVRLAARAAGVSPQTAYRARRASPAFARLWDAALGAALACAEEELASRALHGVEEAVYYRGEEVAVRRRFDSRLLLAHLARLDAHAARAGGAGGEGEGSLMAALDDAIALLAAGTPADALELPEPRPETAAAAGVAVSAQDRVPGVPHPRQEGAAPEAGPGAGEGLAGVPVDALEARFDPATGVCLFWHENSRESLPDGLLHDGSCRLRIPPYGYAEWEETMGNPANWSGGRYQRPPIEDEPAADAEALTEEELEELQDRAFDAGVAEYWAITSAAELEAALAIRDAENQ